MRCWRAARKSSSVALVVWSFALCQFAVASAVLAGGSVLGWSGALFRTYYLFGAVLNVIWLGAGTVWLLAPRLVAQLVTALVAALSTMAAIDVAATPFLPGASVALRDDVPRTSLVLPADVRLWSRLMSITGATVVVAGLIYSIALRRQKTAGLGLLAVGVAVAGVSSELGRAGFMVPFSAGLAAGIAVMYVGFLKTR